MVATPAALDKTFEVRRRPRGGLLLAIAIAVCTSGSFAPQAQAGSYIAQECFLGGSAPDAVYSTNGSLAFTPDVNCNNNNIGVAIGTQGNGFSGPLHAAWTFFSPQGAFLDSVNLGRRSFAGGTYAPIVSVCNALGACSGYSNNTSGNFEPTQFGPGGWSYLSVFIGCGGSTCNAGGHIAIKDLQFKIDDVTAPVVGSLGGSLLGNGTKRGVETLSVGATDAGGGVRRVAIKVNGAEVDSRTLGCNVDDSGIASLLRPCGPASLTFSVNTEGPPWIQGQNLVEVCASDYATGNQPNQGCTTRSVLIDNSCPTSAGGPQASELDAGLQKQGPTSEVSPSLGVRSTQGATVRGELDGPGGPVPAANICLYETIDAEGEIRNLVQVTKTRADGSFAVQIEPGPSRNLDLVYRFSNQVVEKSALHIDSSVRPTLRLQADGVLSNGQNVGFIGAIPGPRASGRPIALQARVGKKWRTFKQIKTNSKGQFTGRYKFTNTQGLVVYRFRARVKRQDGYPYSPGSSKSRTVRVRG